MWFITNTYAVFWEYLTCWIAATCTATEIWPIIYSMKMSTSIPPGWCMSLLQQVIKFDMKCNPETCISVSDIRSQTFVLNVIYYIVHEVWRYMPPSLKIFCIGKMTCKVPLFQTHFRSRILYMKFHFCTSVNSKCIYKEEKFSSRLTRPNLSRIITCDNNAYGIYFTI